MLSMIALCAAACSSKPAASPPTKHALEDASASKPAAPPKGRLVPTATALQCNKPLDRRMLCKCLVAVAAAGTDDDDDEARNQQCSVTDASHGLAIAQVRDEGEGRMPDTTQTWTTRYLLHQAARGYYVIAKLEFTSQTNDTESSATTSVVGTKSVGTRTVIQIVDTKKSNYMRAASPSEGKSVTVTHIFCSIRADAATCPLAVTLLPDSGVDTKLHDDGHIEVTSRRPIADAQKRAQLGHWRLW